MRQVIAGVLVNGDAVRVALEQAVLVVHRLATVRADPVDKYEKKAFCVAGGLMFSEPEKSQALAKDIIEAAYDGRADMIVTSCPVCQMHVEVYQGHINKTYGTKFNIPVVYYSTLMSVAFGRSAMDPALDDQMIRATQLEAQAKK